VEEQKPEEKKAPQKFIQMGTPGLQAIYQEKNKQQTVAPIVGYLIDEDGDRIACVIGDGGRVIPAASIKGFCGVRWEREDVITEIGLGTFGRAGDSLFDRVFGTRR
jgi:hypothetical protein